MVASCSNDDINFRPCYRLSKWMRTHKFILYSPRVAHANWLNALLARNLIIEAQECLVWLYRLRAFRRNDAKAEF